MRIIDISVGLDESTPIYEGNPPLALSWAMRIADGDQVNLSSISMGAHTGTHIDAPYHFIEKGRKIDAMPLNSFILNAQVLHCRGKSIGVQDIQRLSIRRGEGVLFKTSNSSLYSKKFTRDFVYLEGRAAEELVKLRPGIVGIDYLSIEQFGSSEAPAHHTLLSHNIPILEGAKLRAVKEGKYTLIALPVKFTEREAAPARAVLLDPPLKLNSRKA
jgi:arylformamidase